MVTLDHDLRLSENALNYARSMFEGRFAALNVLGQLKSTEFDQKQLDQARKAAERCQTWLNEVYEKKPILSVSWKGPETLDARHLMEMLKFCRDDLKYVYQRIERISKGRERTERRAQAEFLVASSCRAGYSKLLYLMNILEFGKRFGVTEIIDTFTPMLRDATELRELSHQLYTQLSGAAELTDELLEGFTLSALGQVPLFRAQLHDLNQVLHIYQLPFTFEQAEFTPEEAAGWEHFGIPPEIAGYWRACLFTPVETAHWSSRGISIAQTAFEFKVFGFTPETAEPWFMEGFSPFMAADFSYQNMTPHQALRQLGKTPLRPASSMPAPAAPPQEAPRPLISAPPPRLGLAKILAREDEE